MKTNFERGQLGGLCTTCNRAGLCMHLDRATRPVWHCEEFDDHGSEGTPSVEQLLKGPELELTVLEPQAGLCANCDQLKTCSFQHAGGKVWHCEEYS